MQNYWNYDHIKEVRKNYERVGKKWTPEEELQLTSLIKTDKSIDDIAKEHKRTVGGINSRLRELAVRMINKGKTIEEVCVTMRLTREEIEDAQKRRKYAQTRCDKIASIETELDILKDIRDILTRIEAKLKSKSNIGIA